MFHPTETRTRLTTCKFDGSYRSWSHETQRGDTHTQYRLHYVGVGKYCAHPTSWDHYNLFVIFNIHCFADLIWRYHRWTPHCIAITHFHLGIFTHTHSAHVNHHSNSVVLSNTFNVSEREGTWLVTRVTVTDVSRVTPRSNCYFVTHSIHNAEPRPDTCKWAI